MAPSLMSVRTQAGLRPAAAGGRTNAWNPQPWRSARSVAVRVARSGSMREMSSQFKDMRASIEEDEDLSVFMAGLRGTNIDDSDFAGEGVSMMLVTVEEDTEGGLPLEYCPEAIASYWGVRPVSVIKRCLQLLGLSSGFLSRLAWDFARGEVKKNEVARAIEIRNIVTSLGPAYIKLGQALSIRPDLLSPAAMNELQKLCDKVPSFDNKVAMDLLEAELGAPWQAIYAELTPSPIAAASLGQVYKGKLKTGEQVAVKVQRPYVVETVTIDLFILRSTFLALNELMQGNVRTNFVGLLDEWAERFFEELDYIREGENATKFAEQMKDDLPQVVVPKTYSEFTSRRVLTSGWLEGEKLSQSGADDVGTLVNVGVICYLKQLLDTGFFHADPHPGNLIRTPDGRLAVLDFGLMTQVDDNIKFGMIEAVSHLIHRDYEAIVEDFVTLDFIPPGTDLKPILPVLAKVFDQALEGGGAKNINFQDLAADLAQITFDYPFRIPPYFALIIRAIGVLEGIALVGNPEFALVDEAYPYIAQRLLTDESPRLREALRYMVYGKSSNFDMDRMIDLLEAFEDFSTSSRSARGDMDTMVPPPALPSPSSSGQAPAGWPFPGAGAPAGFPFPFPFPIPGGSAPLGLPVPSTLLPLAPPGLAAALGQSTSIESQLSAASTRDALRFMLSSEGTVFREFMLDEAVKSLDALSRDQLRTLVLSLGLGNALVPVPLPGMRSSLSLAPSITEEDRVVISNLDKLLTFLTGRDAGKPADPAATAAMAQELLPIMPGVAAELLPEISQRLVSRVGARLVRDLLVAEA
eukprot:jgi/Tetstr1/449801/TSEL_036865.t1